MADPNAPKTYRRPSDIVAPSPRTNAAPATTVAADPNAPATYKRPDAAQPQAVQPDPNAYKSPDWLPGAGWLHKAGQVFDNAFTANTADYLTGKAGELARAHGIANSTPSVAQLRAETAQSSKDIGPVASGVANAAGYTMGPGRVLGPLAGKLAPVAGRYGAAAVEGMGANAIDVAGNQLGSDKPLNYWDTGKHILAGGVAGIGGQAAGDVVAAVSRPILNYVRGLPGRSSEQWDWRTRAASGPTGSDSVRADVAAEQALRPPSDPAQPALADAQTALSQSTAPGPVAHLGTAAATGVAAKFGLAPYLDQLSNISDLVGLGTGGISAFGFNPVAKTVNAVDRNINVGQSLDRLYPALYPNATPGVDTSGWADSLRQMAIGSRAQPTP